MAQQCRRKGRPKPLDLVALSDLNDVVIRATKGTTQIKTISANTLLRRVDPIISPSVPVSFAKY